MTTKSKEKAPERIYLPDGFSPRTDGYWWASDQMVSEKDIEYVHSATVEALKRENQALKGLRLDDARAFNARIIEVESTVSALVELRMEIEKLSTCVPGFDVVNKADVLALLERKEP